VTQEHQRKYKVERSKARRGYPTDVGEQEWALMEPLLPDKTPTGRPRKTELRAVINALRYLARTG
jgi:putative transposase